MKQIYTIILLFATIALNASTLTVRIHNTDSVNQSYVMASMTDGVGNNYTPFAASGWVAPGMTYVWELTSSGNYNETWSFKVGTSWSSGTWVGSSWYIMSASGGVIDLYVKGLEPAPQEVSAKWHVQNSTAYPAYYSYQATPGEGQWMITTIQGGKTRDITIGPFTTPKYDIQQGVTLTQADGTKQIKALSKVPDGAWNDGWPTVVLGDLTPTNSTPNPQPYPTNSIPQRDDPRGPWALEVTLEDVGNMMYSATYNAGQQISEGIGRVNNTLETLLANQGSSIAVNGTLLEIKTILGAMNGDTTSLKALATAMNTDVDQIRGNTAMISNGVTNQLAISANTLNAINAGIAELGIIKTITQQASQYAASTAISTDNMKTTLNNIFPKVEDIDTRMGSMQDKLGDIKGDTETIKVKTAETALNTQAATNIMGNVANNTQMVTNQLGEISTKLEMTNLMSKLEDMKQALQNIDTNTAFPGSTNDFFADMQAVGVPEFNTISNSMMGAAKLWEGIGGGLSAPSVSQDYWRFTIFGKVYDLNPHSYAYIESLIEWFKVACKWLVSFILCYSAWLYGQTIIMAMSAMPNGNGTGKANVKSKVLSLLGVAFGAGLLVLACSKINGWFSSDGSEYFQRMLGNPLQNASTQVSQGLAMLCSMFPLDFAAQAFFTWVMFMAIAGVIHLGYGIRQKATS